MQIGGAHALIHVHVMIPWLIYVFIYCYICPAKKPVCRLAGLEASLQTLHHVLHEATKSGS